MKRVAGAEAAAARPLALTGGTVIDVASGHAATGQVVVACDGRIRACGPAGTTAIPAGAVRRDVRGQWLTPGLIDMHCHLTPIADEVPLELFLACGVTTVRDPGGPAAELRLLREAVRDGRRPGPRIVASGEILDGNPPAWPARRILADTPQRGVAAVRHLAAQGMECIKVYNGITEPVLAAIVDAAGEEGLPVIGHVPWCMSMRRAVEMGMTGLEHIRVTALDFLSPWRAQRLDALPPGPREVRIWELIDLEAAWAGELIQALAQAGAVLDPTLVVDEVAFGAGLGAQRDHPDNERLPAATRDRWAAHVPGPRAAVPEQFRQVTAGMLAKRKEFVARCAAAGVPVVAGTDGAGLGDLLPGLALHRELGLLRGCGLSPRRALAAATLTAARALGLEREIGALRPGMAADIAVWDADPLSAGWRPESLALVVAAGRCHDPAGLAASPGWRQGSRRDPQPAAGAAGGHVR